MRVLLMAVVSVAAACTNRKVDAVGAAPPPARVPVVQLTAEPFEATVAVTGTLISRSVVDVKAETTGRVLRFSKEEGEQVRAGEPLVWVDDEKYKLSVRQAATAVQLAEAGLERAGLLASHSANELERANNLIASGGITDKDLKAARIADQDARAQVRLAEAQVEQARAALEVARKHQSDTVVHAPVSGEIQKRYVNPGAYVEPPTPVFSLVDNQRLELQSPVPAAELAPVATGQRVTFHVNSFPNTTFEGRVVEIAPAVDPSTRAATVRIAVNNGDRRLRAGMFAEAEIRTGVEQRALVIPASALYRDDRSARNTFVYVVRDGKAARRDVRIGSERGDRLQVASGLNEGEFLIAEQSIEIADGVRVEARR